LPPLRRPARTPWCGAGSSEASWHRPCSNYRRFHRSTTSLVCGVIRTPANKFRLAGFLAYAHPGETNLQVRYYGNLAEGPHAVMLSGDEREIVFTIDGKVRDRVPRATFLPEIGSNDPWLMLGTAVGAPGDAAFGRLSHVRVRNEYDATLTIKPKCIVTTGGITTERAGDALRLGGRFTRGIFTRYRNCMPGDLPG
jgi:hypothetical protein